MSPLQQEQVAHCVKQIGYHPQDHYEADYDGGEAHDGCDVLFATVFQDDARDGCQDTNCRNSDDYLYSQSAPPRFFQSSKITAPMPINMKSFK